MARPYYLFNPAWIFTFLMPQCSFAHGEQELKQKNHLHSNYKTRPCQQYFEKGFCTYGKRCQYLHSELKYVYQFREFLLRVYEEHELMTEKLRNLTLESEILEQMTLIFTRSRSVEEFFNLTPEINQFFFFFFLLTITKFCKISIETKDWAVLWRWLRIFAKKRKKAKIATILG